MYRNRIKQLEAALASLGGDASKLPTSIDDISVECNTDREKELAQLRDDAADLDAEVGSFFTLMMECSPYSFF